MSSDVLVNLCLRLLGCSQRELAERLEVSPAQISKWKKGEYMSAPMENKIRKLIHLGNRSPDFVRMAGSVEDAQKWERLLCYLAELAVGGSETGYHTPLLEEADDHLFWQTLHVLEQMGVELPSAFPEEWDFDYDGNLDDDDQHAMVDALLEDPVVALVERIYKSFTDVYGFYAAYVADLVDHLQAHGDPESSICEIEPCLLLLAAAKLDEQPAIAKRFAKFKSETQRDYIKWLTLLKSEAFRAGLPLRAELLSLVHETHDELGHEAEAESLGFHASRLHPDIYMNELLVGMRVIHQVLPAILKKLGLEDEFKLDTSELRVD